MSGCLAVSNIVVSGTQVREQKPRLPAVQAFCLQETGSLRIFGVKVEELQQLVSDRRFPYFRNIMQVE